MRHCEVCSTALTFGRRDGCAERRSGAPANRRSPEEQRDRARAHGGAARGPAAHPRAAWHRDHVPPCAPIARAVGCTTLQPEGRFGGHVFYGLQGRLLLCIAWACSMQVGLLCMQVDAPNHVIKISETLSSASSHADYMYAVNLPEVDTLATPNVSKVAWRAKHAFSHRVTAASIAKESCLHHQHAVVCMRRNEQHR